MNLLKAKKISGSPHQWSFCKCFICGEDGLLRIDPFKKLSVVLCDEHFAHAAVVNVVVKTNSDMMVVRFKGFVTEGGNIILDVDELIDFYSPKDVTVGDN
jgi:hypothetical protein